MNIQVYQTILNRILFLDYPPGHILNEQVLAEEFGISRTPLRESLMRLEWEQLVRIIPRTGTIVAELEFQKMLHVFQVRLEVEALAGRLAAEQITDEHLVRIEKIGKDCGQLSSQRDRKALASIDRRFREALYDAGNNPVLKDMSEFLYNITFRLWYIISDRGDWAEEVQALLDEIEQTHRSLFKRIPMEAGKLRRESLRMHIERIKSKF